MAATMERLREPPSLHLDEEFQLDEPRKRKDSASSDLTGQQELDVGESC